MTALRFSDCIEIGGCYIPHSQHFHAWVQEQKLRRVYHSPNLENWLFLLAKTAVHCISAGQRQDPGSVAQVLLLKKVTEKFSQSKPLTPPKNMLKLRPCLGHAIE